MTPAAEQVLALRRAAWPLHNSGVTRLSALYRVEPFVAGAALLLAMPLLAMAAAVVTILSRRTPLVSHRRVGWRGEEIAVLKLRTMWEPKQKWGSLFEVEDVSNRVPANKCDGDDRVTSRFAAWCRRYSIDEIPQLYHVLRGEMSLVGPRPITRGELDEHYGDSAETILSLRPGLTGLWQVAGRNRLNYAQRRRLDLFLVRHAAPALYFRVLLRSIPVVLHGHDAY